MKCSIVAFASLLVVGVPRAQGQTYVHYDIGLHTPTAIPASPPTVPEADMVTRIVDEQIALQTGTCASPWTRGLSSQCPPGSFMVLKGYGGNLGLWAPSTFACQPVGCLHAHAHQGGGGGGGEGGEGGGGGGGGGGGDASVSIAWLVSCRGVGYCT